ncbi:MAG: capsule biosynthesis GfcC family protein [Pseudomonadales bacterium]
MKLSVAKLVKAACSIFIAISAQLAIAKTVTVTGAVENPGTFTWQPGTRLLGAAVAAQVRPDAWYQGAALLRESAIKGQRKLKRGIQFDLQTAIVQARAQNAPATVEILQRWAQRIQSMPVTGRVTAELNPLKLWLLSINSLLEPGDRIIYPLRPNSIRVVGAVQQDCILPFSPARDPLNYVQDCPTHEAADPNHLFLIQPDGKVQAIGAAYWNAEDAWIAVGGIVYVPLAPSQFGTSSADFNRELAEWLATQYQWGE